ncbi:FkbM family methyltransferase [Parablautia intestinalis]|jgi:FkbM family methyltransferase|uniref:FkbM family methyltransferase n=1 Tax=Parablautia intestinalis TaxID=2320100 RepID=UPI00256ED3C8|nr:FkbM family methyltransferase [Parablautia intestinalis]MCI8614013.1 FkbM family methyltransferase [Lachnospiraceae bacterium]
MDFEEKLSELKAKTEEICAKNCSMIVWGTGAAAAMYDKAFETAKLNICAYTSNDAGVWGGVKNNCPIIAPNEITAFENPFVLICVKNPQFMSEIRAQLSEMKPSVKNMLVDEFMFGIWADIILHNIERLEDDKSKKIYKSIISKRISGKDKMYEEFEENGYFALPMFQIPDEKEVFVDAGGFVGDTLERYLFKKLGMFKEYYVFEPDKNNYQALLARTDRLKREWNLQKDAVIPIFGGVGKESSVLYFKEVENGSSASHYTSEPGGSESKVYALDDFFRDKKIGFLKADIESWESDMLLGAISIIKRDKPKMAIAIYHNAADMCYILDWIDKLNLGYKFSIRHHTPTETDTTLYAYCDELSQGME